jgi:hypothetical protein
MLVDDFNRIGVAIFPLETDPPTVIYSDAVLPQAVSEQRLQMVSWNCRKIEQRCRGTQMIQLPLRNSLKSCVLSSLFSLKKLRCILRPKRADHYFMLYRYALNGKR